MSIWEELEVGLIAVGAIGLMRALGGLGLNELIDKSPGLFAVAFVVLIVYARKISNGVGG